MESSHLQIFMGTLLLVAGVLCFVFRKRLEGFAIHLDKMAPFRTSEEDIRKYRHTYSLRVFLGASMLILVGMGLLFNTLGK